MTKIYDVCFIVAFAAAVVLGSCLAASAQAPSRAPEAPPAAARVDACAESFPARLADAKRGAIEWSEHQEAYEKVKPLIDFFDAHCRFLSDLERAVRRLDDPNAFVCDPTQKRPKGLTAEIVLQYQVQPDAMHFFMYASEDQRCMERDAKERISLVFSELTELQVLELACYADERPSCVSARETIAKVRAAGIQ